MEKPSEKKWDGKSRGGKFGYLFFIHVIRWFGVRFAYFWLALVVIYFIPFAPKATAAIWDYHRHRLHSGFFRSVFRIYRHYYVFGQTLIDKIALRSGNGNGFRFEFQNYEPFREMLDRNRGAVLIGAHVGCWEAGASFFGEYGKKLNIVMFDSEHESIRQTLEKNQKTGDFKIISTSEDPLGAMIRIKIALNAGEYVCFDGDRYTNRESAVPGKFMGSETLFPTGPFRIAVKCRVPVFFYYAFREPGRRYRFIFDEAEVQNGDTWKHLMDRYIASLETKVREYPFQWFNFYKFWNH